jgi:hypothetical protein
MMFGILKLNMSGISNCIFRSVQMCKGLKTVGFVCVEGWFLQFT